MSQRTSSVGAGIAYELIIGSDIPDFITGKVYRGKRPRNSEVEDVIVRPGTITTGSRQLQFVDILAFVLDIQETPETYTPDTKRLEDISKLIMAVFEYVTAPAYTITVEENQDQNEVEGINQHYVFYRLLFRIDEPIEL